jgi:hypothetical protein
VVVAVYSRITTAPAFTHNNPPGPSKQQIGRRATIGFLDEGNVGNPEVMPSGGSTPSRRTNVIVVATRSDHKTRTELRRAHLPISQLNVHPGDDARLVKQRFLRDGMRRPAPTGCDKLPVRTRGAKEAGHEEA